MKELKTMKRTMKACVLTAAALALPLLLAACPSPKEEAAPMPELPRNVGEALATGTPVSAGENANAAADRTAPIPAADPAAVFANLEGKQLLKGDAVLASRLTLAVKAEKEPGYKLNIDYPFDDGAALGVSQEASAWIRTKMAAFGFSEVQGRPSLIWLVHVQPGQDGSYLLETSLAADGSVQLKETFTVPAQFSVTRMDEVFGGFFVPKAP